ADYKLQEGRGVKLTSGDDAVLISYGPVMLSQAYRAAMLLKESNFGLTVINLPWLNRVDEQWLSEVLAKHKLLITLDNHFIKGGQGEYIASVIPSLGLSSLENVLKLGLTEIPKCGQNDEVLQAHKLDAQSIAARILAASQSRLSLTGASRGR
ncbi:MAG: transketolase, partial [Cyanobacteria bacterium PR.3.49]|nr:transketolase [Cyanobacteria bacterium PR.3.49]